jgi:hypothetical protein
MGRSIIHETDWKQGAKLSELKIVLIVDVDTRNSSCTRRRIRNAFPHIKDTRSCIVTLSSAEEAIPFIRELPYASYFLILELDQRRYRITFNEPDSEAPVFADGIWLAHYTQDFMHVNIYQSVVFARNGQCLEYERMRNFLFVKGSVSASDNWPFIQALLSTFFTECNTRSLDIAQAPP